MAATAPTPEQIKQVSDFCKAARTAGFANQMHAKHRRTPDQINSDIAVYLPQAERRDAHVDAITAAATGKQG